MIDFPTTAASKPTGRGLTRKSVGPLFLLLSGLLCMPVAVAQQGRGFGRDADFGVRMDPRFGVLEVERTLRVERVGPAEVIGGARARSEGHYVPGGLATIGLDLDTRVVRTIPAVWRLRVPSVDDLQRMNFRIELGTPDGRRNVLTHPSDPGSVVYARVDPTPPRVIDVNEDGVLIEGGLTLQLDLQRVRAAGSHTGTLTVTMENF